MSTDRTQPAPDPLSVPGVTCILLSEAASRRLLLEGDAFAIIARTSHPQAPNRVAIFCQQIGPHVSRDVCKILRGGFRAVPIKKKKLKGELPPAPLKETLRTAYKRQSIEPLVNDPEERVAALELGDLRDVRRAADRWLRERGLPAAATSGGVLVSSNE